MTPTVTPSLFAERVSEFESAEPAAALAAAAAEGPALVGVEGEREVTDAVDCLRAATPVHPHQHTSTHIQADEMRRTCFGSSDLFGV